MEEDESYEELSDRIAGLRLILEVLIAQLPNRYEVMHALQKAEALARARNLPTGTLQEMADLRGALDDM